MPRVNPLDAFKVSNDQRTNDLRVPSLPKVAENVAGKGLVPGLQQHDLALEEWRANFERQLNERVAPQAAADTTAATITALQTTIAGLQTQIATLSAKVIALGNPSTTTIVTSEPDDDSALQAQIDALSSAPAPLLAVSSMLITEDTTLPSNYCCVVTSGIEIESGFVLILETDSVLAII